MQLYDNATTNLEGGVAWSPTGRVFRALLLAPGAADFVAADATVTAVLAHTRNVERTAGDYDRLAVEYVTSLVSPGIRDLRFHVRSPVGQVALRDGLTGTAIIYEFATVDADSKPIAFIKELHLLAGGDGVATQVAVGDEVVTTALDVRADNLETDGVFQIGTLLISATPEKFKTTTTLYWRRLGIQFTKAATDNLVFASADTINTGAAAGLKWGVWLVQITDTGTVTTKSPAADQVYASEAAAIAALPAADAGNVAIGYITVEAKTGADWVAITDDLTPTSDCQDANFYDAALIGA